MRGLTLLPFPQDVSNIDEEEKRVSDSKGKDVDTRLKNNIEAIVSKWAYQVISNLSPSLYILLIYLFRLMRCSPKTQLKKLTKVTTQDP